MLFYNNYNTVRPAIREDKIKGWHLLAWQSYLSFFGGIPVLSLEETHNRM